MGSNQRLIWLSAQKSWRAARGEADRAGNSEGHLREALFWSAKGGDRVARGKGRSSYVVCKRSRRAGECFCTLNSIRHTVVFYVVFGFWLLLLLWCFLFWCIVWTDSCGTIKCQKMPMPFLLPTTSEKRLSRCQEEGNSRRSVLLSREHVAKCLQRILFPFFMRDEAQVC